MNAATAALAGLTKEARAIDYNWPQILKNLLKKATYDEIENYTGITKRMAGDIIYLRVDQPRFSHAVHLLDLHSDLCVSRHNRISI